jgi:hypothetical protein
MPMADIKLTPEQIDLVRTLYDRADDVEEFFTLLDAHSDVPKVVVDNGVKFSCDGKTLMFFEFNAHSFVLVAPGDDNRWHDTIYKRGQKVNTKTLEVVG